MSQANNPVPTDARKARREIRQEAHFEEVTGDEAGPESRRFPRATVELDVSLGSDHNFYAGFAENLSVGGVFVATHMLRPVGELIDLSIHIPESELLIKGTGQVRWVREYNEDSDVPPGMGVKFTKLEEGAEDSIEKFLAQRDPIFFDDDF